MRRALIILAIIIVLLGGSAAAYLYLFSGSAGIEVTQPTNRSLPSSEQANVVETGTDTSASPTVSAISPARLVKISAGPIVPGQAVVATPAGNGAKDVAVQYIERRSGNVYRYLTHTGTVTRTSNRTLPGIMDASWLPNASKAFVRYLSGADMSTVNTYVLPSDGTGGFFLAQDLKDIAVASTSVLTLASGVNGSVASVERPDGSRSSVVFTTPLSSLRVSFAGPTHYLAFTKPSATIMGYAFLVDAKGRFSRIAGPLAGLTALSSNSGKWVLIGYTQAGEMRMDLVNTATKETLPLPVATIVDKCVWTANDTALYCGIPTEPSANYAYPDDWYQGAVQFSDRIWKIDVAGRYAQLVLDLSKEAGDRIDTEALAVDANTIVLSFINKMNGSLWAYQI